MRTWNIARVLVESCSSPEEVDQVIGTLQNRDAILHVCTILGAFSSAKPESMSRTSKSCTAPSTDGNDLLAKVEKDDAAQNGGSGTLISKETIVSELASLFRSRGMTNRQVAQWTTDNFGVQINIGKDSLPKYLTRVLKDVDTHLTNRIVLAAKQIVTVDKSPAPYRNAGTPKTSVTGSYGSSTQIGMPVSGRRKRGDTLSFKEASASQLGSLFRTSGMANKQVEEWITDNFNVHATVGKSSLHKYLSKVLNDADLGLTNRILAAAQRLANGESIPASEIRKYWDEQDKHFSAVE